MSSPRVAVAGFEGLSPAETGLYLTARHSVTRESEIPPHVWPELERDERQRSAGAATLSNSPGTENRTLQSSEPQPSLDGYSIYKTAYPPPVFLFDGLLANGLTILAGRPKSGKSWLTLQMAIDAAMRRSFLGRFGVKGAAKVLYFGLEEAPARTHNRLRMLVPRADIQLQNIEFRYSLNSLADGGAEELENLLTVGGYELLVVDTFLKVAKASGGNNNVMRSEYREIAQLQELAQRYKLAIVLVHHTRKMSAESGLDTVAGTTGITAACDAVWTLRKQASGESILEITGREMEEQTLALRLESGETFGWRLIGEGAEVGMSEARQEIVELLKDDAPLSPRAIATSLRKNAVTVRRLLQKLAAGDIVRKDRSGKYYLTHTMNSVNNGNAVDDEAS